MTLEPVVDYWNFFTLGVELGLRSVVVSLMELLPALRSGGSAGIWAVAALYVCESIWPWRRSQRRLREGVWLDLFYTAANFLLFYQLVGTPIFQTVEVAFRSSLHELLGIELGTLVSLRGVHPWIQYLLMFLYVDLISYVGHIMLHKSRLLWTFHRVHHSAKQLDVLNAVRQHWAEKLFYDFLAYVPLALVGFEVEQAAVVVVASMFFCTFTHSNLRVPLGPARYLLNNPQLHVWHHAKQLPHDRNVNYGSVLSLWDYLFRTSHLPEERGELELGFDGMEEFPTTLLRQQLHPLDRLLPRPTRLSRALGRGVALGLTAVTLLVVVLGDSVPARVLKVVHVGYRQRAAELLGDEQPGVALAVIQGGALIDRQRLDSLKRLLDASHDAAFAAPAIVQLLKIAQGGADLRFRTGRAVLSRLEGAHALDARQRDLLGRATRNAQLLVGLQPGRPRSHYQLGRSYRLRAEVDGSREDLERAVAAFSRAVALDPDYPGAREALEDVRASWSAQAS